MRIREFASQDAKACSALSIECLKKVNAKDYPSTVIKKLVKTHTPEFYLKKSENEKIFVMEEDGKIIGTGSISGKPWRPWGWGGPLTVRASSIFVDVNYQGKGIGTKIMKKIEDEAKNMDVSRIIVLSALGAVPFYVKLGYVETERPDKGDFGIQVKMEKLLEE